MNTKKNKLVLFGAGKIGRSFIGQLFCRGGYDVVFIDISKTVVDELNKRKSYQVIVKDDNNTEVLNISSVSGIHLEDKNKVINEIADAELLAVSIGVHGLPDLMPLLADGLVLRENRHGSWPLDIIIAENLRNASLYFRQGLTNYLPAKYPIDELVGLVETSIGKMVPIMTQKDIEQDLLQVYAEPYNDLILDEKGFKNVVPTISGLFPKRNIKAWVDRKLFIHNLGHASAAYIAYLYNHKFIYLYEALSVSQIKMSVRKVMVQSANILLKKYPDEFTKEDLLKHIDDLILRFQNRALGDTIFRVGSDLKRKLAAEDRIAGAIHLASALNMPYDNLLLVLIFACRFRATDENGCMHKNDIEFDEEYKRDGLKFVLKDICHFKNDLYNDILTKATLIDNKIKGTNQNILGLFTETELIK